MFLKALDEWSNNQIKNSLIGKTFSWTINKINLAPSIKVKNILYVIFVSFIYILFVSLALPQFADDRFGIGVIILISLLFFVFNLLTRNFQVINFNLIDLFIILLLINSVISTFSSYFFKESVIGLLKYVIFFLFYFQIKILLLNSSKNNLINLYCVTILIGLIISLIGIHQYIIHVEPLATWEDPSLEKTHTRVYSTLGNPNLLAGYLLPILPISLMFFFYKTINPVIRVMFIVSSLAIILCLIFTGSRGGYLGLLAQITLAIVILISYLTNKKKLSVFLLILASLTFFVIFYLVLTFLFPEFLERLITIFTLREYSSNSYRLNVYSSCLRMLNDNFLIGIGPGNTTFRLSYGLYMLSGFDALSSYNILLELAIELGLIGSLILLLIFLISFIRLHYLFWNSHSLLGFGIFLSLIGIFVQGMVDTVFFRAQVLIPFFFLIATTDRLELDESISKI